MLHLTRWCGVSFVLHLALASAVILGTSHQPRRPRQPVVVTLDFLQMPLPAEPVAPPEGVPARLRPAPPAPVPVRSVPVRPAAAAPMRPAAPVASKPPATPVTPPMRPEPPRQAQAKPPPERPASLAAVAGRQSATVAPADPPREGAVSKEPGAVPPAPVSPAPRNATAAAREPGAAAHQAQQRYAKEHFAYIRELITGRLVYPAMARRMNWSGKTTVAFTIDENGSVHALKVVESSGYQILDKSALEAVRNVAPFPEPPVRTRIVIPISFTMQER